MKLRRKVDKEVTLLAPGEFLQRQISGVLQQTEFDPLYYTILSRYKPARKIKRKDEAIKEYRKEQRERFEILFSIEKRKRYHPILPR